MAQDTTQHKKNTDESPQLMKPGVGSGVALLMLCEKLIGGLIVGGSASAMAGKDAGTGIRNKRLRYFMSGFGTTTIVSSLYNNGFRLLGGITGGDRTLAGDGVAGLTGDAVAASVAGVGLGVVSLSKPLTKPMVIGTLGLAVTVGALSGHIARDASPKFRHFTDDIVAQNILIAHTPEAIKGPGSKLYKALFNLGKRIIEPVKDGARSLFGMTEKPKTPVADVSAPETPPAVMDPARRADVSAHHRAALAHKQYSLDPDMLTNSAFAVRSR